MDPRPLLVVVVVVACAALVPDPKGSYASSAPDTWDAEAQRVARDRLARAERFAADRQTRSHHSEQLKQLAQREYAQASKLVREREASSELNSLERHALVLKKKQQRILASSLRLEKRALQVERQLATGAELGEARDSIDAHSIRAAQMTGNAARWRVKAERWQTGADKVEEALKASSEARAVSAVQAENDKIVQAEERTRRMLSKQNSEAAGVQANALSAERRKVRADRINLSQQLRNLHQQLETQQSTGSEEWEALRHLLPAVHSLQRESVAIRGSLEGLELEEADVVQTTKQIEKDSASAGHASARLHEMLEHQRQIRTQLAKADVQAAGAEHDAIELLSRVEQKLPSASSQAVLGESSLPSSLHTLSQGQKELLRVKRQQRVILRQVKQHGEMKTKFLVKDVQVEDRLKTKQLTKQIQAVKLAISRGEEAIKRQHTFVRNQIKSKLRGLHHHAMKSVVDETEAISLQDQEIHELHQALRVHASNQD